VLKTEDEDAAVALLQRALAQILVAM